MTRSISPKRNFRPSRPAYVLEEQIGFILRQVWQRHAAIFAEQIGANLTPTQWAALAKLTETSADPEDGRRLKVSLTRAGRDLAEKVAANALAITRETLAPLDAREREMLTALLSKLR